MIRCEHIYKSFDGKPVLEDISATFLPGEINMIIGRSGSGKTVLIKSIAGLFPVDEGEIYYGDTLFTSLYFRQKKAIRRDVGMIFQGAPCSTLPLWKRTSAFRLTCSPARAWRKNGSGWPSACTV